MFQNAPNAISAILEGSSVFMKNIWPLSHVIFTAYYSSVQCWQGAPGAQTSTQDLKKGKMRQNVAESTLK